MKCRKIVSENVSRLYIQELNYKYGRCRIESFKFEQKALHYFSNKHSVVALFKRFYGLNACKTHTKGDQPTVTIYEKNHTKSINEILVRQQ